MKAPRVRLCLVLVVILGAWPGLAGGQEAGGGLCGPLSVWSLPWKAFSACLEASPEAASCLLETMKDAGAPPQALACAKALDGEGFLRAYTPMGRVSLAEAEFPLRANSNRVPYLVGGEPPAVSSELAQALDIAGDPAYPDLKKRYPNLELWPGDAVFRSMERPPGGGQGFVFAYPLRDGCHACAVAGQALVRLDFDAKGVFKGPRLIRLEPAKEGGD